MSILDGIAAMNGDREAARRYCGDYLLVMRSRDNNLFRCRKGSIPDGFHQASVSAYDGDGYLKSEYWSLPRVEDQQ